MKPIRLLGAGVFWIWVVALYPLLAVPLAVRADPGILVAAAWSRATLPGTGSGAIYMTITNASERPLVLRGADCELAEHVQLHETKLVSDMVTMRAVEQLEIPAGGKVNLQPRGLHFMLSGLTKPLVAGDHFTLRLWISEAGAHATPQAQDAQVLVGTMSQMEPPES